jgi:hypothetical protein
VHRGAGADRRRHDQLVHQPDVPDDPIKGGPAGGFDGTQIEAPGYASPFN